MASGGCISGAVEDGVLSVYTGTGALKMQGSCSTSPSHKQQRCAAGIALGDSTVTMLTDRFSTCYGRCLGGSRDRRRGELQPTFLGLPGDGCRCGDVRGSSSALFRCRRHARNTAPAQRQQARPAGVRRSCRVYLGSLRRRRTGADRNDQVEPCSSGVHQAVSSMLLATCLHRQLWQQLTATSAPCVS